MAANGAMKVVAVIQARTSSSRFPGKMLALVGDVTLLERMLGQVKGAKTLDEIVVATSADPSDDELARRISAGGTRVFRGDLEDVLARFKGASDASDADVIVRLTGDCPLHTPDTIDDVVAAFLASDVDYASNREPYTRRTVSTSKFLPEIALARAAREALPGPDREHVTPFLRRDAGVRRLHHIHSTGRAAPDARWTVDDTADLDFVKEVWKRLDLAGPGPHSYETVMTAAISVAPTNSGAVANFGYYKSLYATATAPRRPHCVLMRMKHGFAEATASFPAAHRHTRRAGASTFAVSLRFFSSAEAEHAYGMLTETSSSISSRVASEHSRLRASGCRSAAYERAQLGHSFSLPIPSRLSSPSG
jgi:spore coat polysaccharide biosynthesis protein SpsF (cytidylyltransferase family)